MWCVLPAARPGATPSFGKGLASIPPRIPCPARPPPSGFRRAPKSLWLRWVASRDGGLMILDFRRGKIVRAARGMASGNDRFHDALRDLAGRARHMPDRGE